MRAAYIRGLVLCAVLLAGCFAAQAAQAGQLADDPDAPWIPGLPIANSFAGIVELDSDPSGAEATTSLGGSCRTPCALELSAEGPFTVTFTHEGYEPTTVEVKIQHARMVSTWAIRPSSRGRSISPVAHRGGTTLVVRNSGRLPVAIWSLAASGTTPHRRSGRDPILPVPLDAPKIQVQLVSNRNGRQEASGSLPQHSPKTYPRHPPFGRCLERGRHVI